MKSLIIGITGCSGSFLAKYLVAKGVEVYGTKRNMSSLKNLQNIINKIHIFNVDINNKESIVNVLNNTKPEHIYFLASANRFQSLEQIYNTNVNGTISFFESVAKSSFSGRILIVSSSAVYGIQKEIQYIDEKFKLLPVGHYGLSKVFQEEAARYYLRNFNLDVIIARPFNFTGPGEAPDLVCTDFAKQIVDIESGKNKPIITVGNVNSKRDFTDVRDIVRGYALLAEKGIKGDIYNLCSGKAYTIQTILEKLLSLSTVDIKVEINLDKVKEPELNVQVGNNSKISSLTGWKPQIPLDKTLEDILIYNREEVDKHEMER